MDAAKQTGAFHDGRPFDQAQLRMPSADVKHIEVICAGVVYAGPAGRLFRRPHRVVQAHEIQLLVRQLQPQLHETVRNAD